MSESLTVVAICGSLRDESHTRSACRHALSAAADAGAETELIDLREYELPVFDADNDEAGDAPLLRTRLRQSDAIILASPMYHGSYAAPLKNALDYCGFDEFEGTTVGLLGVSGGSFPLTTLEHLRSVGRALDAWVIPHQAAVPSASEQFEDGEFVDEDMAERVRTLGRRAVQYANIEPDPHSFESEENVGAED
jgi:NAD(P)H-dependent FMN reductase